MSHRLDDADNELRCVAYEPGQWDWLSNRWNNFKNLFKKTPDSGLIQHAKREFLAAGYIPLDQEQEEDPNKWIQECVLELLRVFSKQGHSGFSAPYCVDLFSKLAKYKIMTPLSGDDSEWNEVGPGCGSIENEYTVFQNNRASNVFKEVYADGSVTYNDIDAIVYVDPGNSSYTSGRSRSDPRGAVVFPYTPKTTYVNVDFEGNELTQSEWSFLNNFWGWIESEFPCDYDDRENGIRYEDQRKFFDGAVYDKHGED
jgi:hypothetical protein